MIVGPGSGRNQLYLGPLPGLERPIRTLENELRSAEIHAVVCLNPPVEIEHLSPEYSRWREGVRARRDIVGEMSYAGIGACATSFGKTIEPIRPPIEQHIDDFSSWTLSEEKGRLTEWSVGMLMIGVFNLDHHLGISLLRVGYDSDEELAVIRNQSNMLLYSIGVVSPTTRRPDDPTVAGPVATGGAPCGPAATGPLNRE